MAMDGWFRREDLEDDKKIRAWQDDTTDRKLYVEDMTFIDRGYTVFLFDESLYSSKKLGEFSTQEAAIDHATTWTEENADSSAHR